MPNTLLVLIGNIFSYVGNFITIFGLIPFVGLLITYFVVKDTKNKKIIKYILWSYAVGPVCILIAILLGIIVGITE